VGAALVVVVRSISNSYNKYIQQVHQVGFSFIH
jgi:hypothetical protein